MPNDISFDKTYKQFHTDNILSYTIYENLEDNQHITEQTFIKACRDAFKYNLKQLKEQTKIEYLRLSYYSSGFNLVAARKKTEKEKLERIEEEKNSTRYRQSYMIKDIENAEYLNDTTIDTLIEILNKKKLKLNKNKERTKK